MNAADGSVTGSAVTRVSLRRQWTGLALTVCMLATATPLAQEPWTVTVTPTLNPLPIGLCGAIQLTIVDPATKDAPRNTLGYRVTMADFDMAVTGAAVAGRRIDATHFEVCACQGGAAGGSATVTATYRGRALDPKTRAPVASFQKTATFALALAKGAINPAACVGAAAAPAPAAPPVAVALPPAPPPVALATPPVPPAAAPPTQVARPPVAPPAPIALPPTAAPVTRSPVPAPAPAPVPAPAAPPAPVGLPQLGIPVSNAPSAPPAPAPRGGNTGPLNGERPDAPRPTTPTSPETSNPIDFTALQSGPGEVFLSWRPVTGVSAYLVTGAGLSGGFVSGSAIVPGTATTVTARGVPIGNHEWTVGSAGPGGIGIQPLTSTAQFTRVTLNVVLGQWRVNPAGFTAVQTAPGQVQLSWQPVIGPWYYTLRGPGVPAGGLRVEGATTATATAVPIGSQQWELESVYEFAPFRTAASEFPRVTLNVVVMRQNPSGFSAVQTAPGQVQLSWQPVTGASYYALLGPGLPAGGAKVSGATTFTATAVPAGSQEWAVASFYDAAPVSTAAAAFPRVTLNVTAPAVPPPPATTPTAPPVLSGRYQVIVTGLRAYQASVDDQLSRDGVGDEVYAAASVRRYDRATGQIKESLIRKTMPYGDVNKFDTPVVVDGFPVQRIQAGSRSGTGGIQDGDPIPPGPLVAVRSAPAQWERYPWKLWEGSLTDGVDALVITPSIWEQDVSNVIYTIWKQQQQALDQSLFTTQSVLDQIAQKEFGVLVSGAAGIGGGTGFGSQLRTAVDMTLIQFALPFVTLLQASNDRPIGLMANGFDSAMLLNHAVVLTREIIEAALALPALGSIPSPVLGHPAPMARIGVIAPKPGVLVIQFEDRNMPGLLGIPERPAIYQMFVQVERIP